MPRSVQVAIGTACLLASIGALSAAIWIADAAGGGWATRWLSTALHGYQGVFERVASPLYLVAIAIVPIALRRDARQARIAFQLALLAAITLAVTFLGLSGSALAIRHLDAGLAAMLLVLGLIGLLAWSLSRPSAKAWFASG